jgi:hypothetical protein
MVVSMATDLVTRSVVMMAWAAASEPSEDKALTSGNTCLELAPF